MSRTRSDEESGSALMSYCIGQAKEDSFLQLGFNADFYGDGFMHCRYAVTK